MKGKARREALSSGKAPSRSWINRDRRLAKDPEANSSPADWRDHHHEFQAGFSGGLFAKVKLDNALKVKILAKLAKIGGFKLGADWTWEEC